jgi:hypothetical protein
MIQQNRYRVSLQIVRISFHRYSAGFQEPVAVTSIQAREEIRPRSSILAIKQRSAVWLGAYAEALGSAELLWDTLAKDYRTR